jgi:hypothetical protein
MPFVGGGGFLNNEEILMLLLLEILALQVIIAILGTISIGTADWLHHRGRIRQRLHSLWVASSSAAICLPVFSCTTIVFLGVGMVSWVLVGTLEAMMFLWIYRNVLKVHPVQKLRSGLMPLGSAQTPIPPSSNING